MRLRYLFLALSFASLAFQVLAQCPPGQDEIRIEINSDSFFGNQSWMLTSEDGAIVYGAGTLVDSSTNTFIFCVPSSECVKFTIMDSANDGFFPDGVYRLYVNGNLAYTSKVGSFFATESVVFNCAPGISCNGPIILTTGSGTTPTAEETWYSFTPVDTGRYVFTTCGAVCHTKIWVYNQCTGILISENLLGAIYYTDTGCPDGAASAIINLAGGQEYFIRTRYDTIGCSAEPIPYTLTFLGPIVGCMDPNACNYEPFATLSSGNCLYPGDPACPFQPDLIVDQNLLINSLELSNLETPNACTVEEGCLRGFGTRNVLKFSTKIDNIGGADYWIGKPPLNPNEPSTQFVYDPCHGHWHYLGYAEYILYNSAGMRIPIGLKAGFCVLDISCPDISLRKYNCENMGLTATCFDVYTSDLPCQWIDITDIPEDNYTLVVRVNWDQSPDKIGRVEKTFDNNWAQACFSLQYDGTTPDVVFNTDSCKQFIDCAGQVFGNAQPDCNGLCNGPALFGDWNQDTVRNATDEAAYLTAALIDNSTATSCNDLYADNQIDVFDAALLQECNLHSNDQQYWIQRFPCQFPTGFLNAQDLVTIQPASIDTVAKTFDIEIVNPYHSVMGYEFSVSGLVITAVENLATEHQVAPGFNPTTGKIIALAGNESGIKKNNTPAVFLRVHYSTLTDHTVCVSEITAVVNNKYQKSNATIGDPSCLPVTFVAVSEPNLAPFAVFVQPNPMLESTTVFFENENAEAMTFTLIDLTGRTLRSFNNLRGESVKIERNGLPQGTYLFTLRGDRGSVSGKIIIR